MYIETKNLVKTFSGRNVVDGVSLRVDKGQVVGLLGPNGAGKTTSFYMIVGIERPSSGIITVDGKDITNIPMYKRAAEGIGYLPQEASIFRSMSVEDNIRAMLQITAKKPDEIEAIVESLIEEFHIGHIKNSMPEMISGGEKQRISIARAFLKDAPILILDEMTSNVDPVNESLIQDAITELAKNRTVLVVAHHLKTIQKADQILVFQKGNLLEKGKHGELLAKDGYYTKLWKAQYGV